MSNRQFEETDEIKKFPTVVPSHLLGQAFVVESKSFDASAPIKSVGQQVLCCPFITSRFAPRFERPPMSILPQNDVCLLTK